MKMNTWQLQDAKSKFSQLVEKALHNGPQFVTKHGNNAVVILSFKEYQEITRPKSDLVTFLRSSPLVNSELDISRDKNPPRDLENQCLSLMGLLLFQGLYITALW